MAILVRNQHFPYCDKLDILNRNRTDCLMIAYDLSTLSLSGHCPAPPCIPFIGSKSGFKEWVGWQGDFGGELWVRNRGSVLARFSLFFLLDYHALPISHDSRSVGR